MNQVEMEICRIYEAHGKVTPSLLLNEAASEESPLHKLFDWCDETAAHAYRLIRARTLIRSVRIEVNGVVERLIHVPVVFANDEASKEGFYKPLSVIISQPSEFERAMTAALAKLAGAEEAVSELRAAASTAENDTTARLSIALQAIRTARDAIRSLH